MLFVLSGPSYVGKKTSIAHFMKLYSFSSVIPYTTKPDDHRLGETEGLQYHYVEETSRNDITNDSFIYDEPFNFGEYKETILYAYKKKVILILLSTHLSAMLRKCMRCSHNTTRILIGMTEHGFSKFISFFSILIAR